jgi:hypothetical protein
MLTNLVLRNFRNHTRTSLAALAPLSVLVGPNGVGKSAVLEAADILHHLGRVDVDELLERGGPHDPARLVRRGSPSFSISADGTVGGSSYSVALTAHADPTKPPRATVGNPPTTPSFANGALDVPPPILRALTGASYFRLEPSELRESSYPEHLPPRIAPNGYGLASAVSFLMRTDPDAHRELTERLRSVVPVVTGLRSNPVKMPRATRRKLAVDGKTIPFDTNDIVIGDELLFDTVDARGIPGSAASEGTLFVLGLLAAMALPDRPSLLLLDDVETGLHPKAQRQLVRVLRDLTSADPALQMIVTTHSPYVVDEVAPEQVWALGRGPKGVRAARLADHPNAAEALGVLTTGEFWSTEGENWEARVAK